MTRAGLRFDWWAAFAAVAVVLTLARADAVAPTADLARGEHLATALAGCTDCHGASFAGGRSFTRDGVTVFASNLTGGAGGIGGRSDADLRRAIRTGVAPDGSRLLVMPWRAYAVMTDADVDDLIAYLRTLPPVDNAVQSSSAVPSAGAPARPASASPAVETSAASPPAGGAYIATIGGCLSCHGANLAGGARYGGIIAPNISHAGIGAWSFGDFVTAMRTGKTPDGRVLAAVMPWRVRGHMTDAELRALYDFLESSSAPAN